MLHCDRCNRDFSKIDALEQHQTENKRHRVCEECEGKIFPSRKEFVDHCVKLHLYCIECDRFFREPAELINHLSSSLHQAKLRRCPGKGCKRKFICISALMNHLESGSCKSGANRAVVNRIVVRLDAHNVITDPNRLIAGPEGYEAPPSALLYATPTAWNGTSFECFLCHSEFTTLLRLDHHFRSPVHDEEMYRCPNTEHCKRELKVLSSLCMHVEGDKCGVQRFQYAKEAIQSFMAGLNALEL